MVNRRRGSVLSLRSLFGFARVRRSRRGARGRRSAAVPSIGPGVLTIVSLGRPVGLIEFVEVILVVGR